MPAVGANTLFEPRVVSEMINLVTGSSALARMSGARPIEFTGQREFTFSLDKEVDLVGENQPKSPGGATITPVTIVPVKVEYSARFSDEFMHAEEEAQLRTLMTFAEGFARKVARGIDLMALQGINPRGGQKADLLTNKNFADLVDQTVTVQSGALADASINAAIAMVQGSGFDVDGLIMSPELRTALSNQTENGARTYPELAWGKTPDEIKGIRTATTTAITANNANARGLVGDFERYFRWGYAGEIPIEIIEYGNPDNDTVQGDLKGRNQILMRGEAYIGWGILAPDAFAWIKAGT